LLELRYGQRVMKFGKTPLKEAQGAILAHSMRFGDLALAKGRKLNRADINALRAAGIDEVTAARLGINDVGEDAAAKRIAAACAGKHISRDRAETGRVNLNAGKRGVLIYDRACLDRLNRVHEAVTCAGLGPGVLVEAGRMVATVKIIPYGVPEKIVSKCQKAAGAKAPLLSVAPLRALKVGLIQTTVAKTSEKMLTKTARVTAERVTFLGGRIVREVRMAHERGAIADAISGFKRREADLIVVAGASAIADRRDTVPAGIEMAGGRIAHFGMPVDPGNLLLLAYLADGRPVVGLPGCARSPKFNGFDLVLGRLFAGLSVDAADIMAMGAGGLLQEIKSRPRPREG